MMSSNSNIKETTILSLSEWVRRALIEVDLSAHTAAYGADALDQSKLPATIRTSMALCSDDYLMPALRLAYSLVDQICKEEAKGKSLTPSGRWVDNIVVYANNRVGRRDSIDSLDSQGFIDSLGFNPSHAGGDIFDSNNMFEEIIHDSTALSNEERLQDLEGVCDVKAEFAPSLFLFNFKKSGEEEDDGGLELERKFIMQRIYSLGVVFYVIFSGGERPPHFPSLTELVDRKVTVKSDTETEELSQELSEDLDSLPFDQQAKPNDSAGDLSIFDQSDQSNDYIIRDRDPFDNSSFDDAHQDQNRKKKHSSQQTDDSSNNCSVQVQSLKEQGLPSPLCDLVANMLDCTNSSLSGEDSYQSMSDVRGDLRLMLDNPNTFLRDLDMTNSSTTGLQFIEKTMFGRNAELSSIKDAYRRSIVGESELVTIAGASGAGKSLLANEFGEFVSAGGGIFLSGKFDQLHQGKPFSALASTFDQYCGILLHENMASTKEEVASKLRSLLGKEVYQLTKIIPNLATILGSEASALNHNEYCIDAQKRVQYLLCQFVEVITTLSPAPIALLLDDLQWADAASIAAVNQLLFATVSTSHKNFFFLGCAREKDSATKWLPGVDMLVAGGIKIKLDCLDENTLNTMVSETLCLSPRLTQTLSTIICHKTKGNPLFVSRLMCSLCKEGLLYLSLSRRRWQWDTKQIRSRRLPDDVAMFLTNSLGELPYEVRWALFVLSCFGASSESAFVVQSQGLGSNILNNLDIAVTEGVVDKIDDRYSFAHDRIQEAAYNTMPEQKRCLVHFKNGLKLSSLLIGEDADASSSTLFTAVNQLNLGGPPAVQVLSHYLTAARLNLRAGKKAMEMSDYETAYSYFDSGISFLRKNHWQDHYTLSVELFSLAAKCALTNGDHTSLKLLIDAVLAKARVFEDKLDVLYLDVCQLTYSSLSESIEKGLDILFKLSIDIELDGSDVDAHLQATKDLVSSHTDGEILNSNPMTDPTMIMAMKLLGIVQLGMNMIMPKAAPHVAFKIIQLSLTHGMSPVSPTGFAYFGSYLAKQETINEGYHYVKLALSLLDRVGSRENAGEVILVCTQVKLYVEPLQATLEHHKQGYAAAMASGDSNLAIMNLFAFNAAKLFAGVNLQRMQELYADSIKFSEERKQLIVAVSSKLMQRTVTKLIGAGEGPEYSSEEQDILASNSNVLRSQHYQTAYVNFIFRSYDDTVENMEKYFAFQQTTWGALSFAHAVHAFYTGLISFWAARKSKEQRWYERGNKSKLALRKWAETCRWTFENKWFLLEAEEAFRNNDFEAAKAYYKKAVTSAKSHKVRCRSKMI